MPEKYYFRAILKLCQPIIPPGIPKNYYHTQGAKEAHFAENVLEMALIYEKNA
ncbi:hypothetical protein LMR84_15065 [Klebsiella variicola]|uniref:hypothetical protein n=1 Tax=Klebsiella variicola TaxID=244366 RepID=UPI0015F2B78B|nr:hypothetical protein [Klebsiella variicola]MCC5456313.1 hypothetical protein [Klebsiella variicola]